jgi:hypothetical protein
MCNICEKSDVLAKGMCAACYMRERRNTKRGYVAHRRPNGQNEDHLLQAPQNWLDRFRSKIEVKPSGCHEWTAAKTKSGYGVFTVIDITVLAHRLAHRLNGGESAEVIMHTCDNPSCCNPDHLVAGTYVDNMADMDAKGRRVVSRADHLRDRKSHPRAKPVVTPYGEFPSASLAAEHIGVGVRVIQKKCKQNAEGYGYA